ncbi:hypothetical protein RN001_011568 [Aquatica leii]|uniref:Peptidase metallopeptidase domain-containing protein n=1 Tax=Aquatica leii TaxID=1421715 RepID=A0AAN7S7G9_9COLE|nr:hypothetical protein RN001_011568 [Aquatica leii]
MNALSLGLTLILCNLVVSSPLGPGKEPKLNTPEDNPVINYLVRFGYLDEAKSYSTDHVKEGLKKLQNFFSLPETGVADEATLELINTPRCGVPDIVTDGKRYTIADKPFTHRNITYMFGRYSPKLNKAAVDENIKLAFDIWAVNSTLTFTKVNSNPDIMIDFVTRVHNDLKPFDGPGGVYAHAYYPSTYLSGDLHFDEEEDWKIMTAAGVDFFSVALHELGHSLGLGHSNLKRAVMHSSYKFIDKKRGLEADDKLGIYSLYVLGEKPPKSSK